MDAGRPEFSPIAIFAYRRTRHLALTLDALERCPEFSESPVFVFSDGPRTPDVATDVGAVRAMLAARCRPNMNVIEAPQNRGLARSIIAGVTQLCESHGRVIVIEDDLIAAPSLLTWFNRALDRYAAVENVWQVSAHQFAAPQFAQRRQSMFLNLSTSWGWATWARAWKSFDPAAQGWQNLARDPALRVQFDLNGAYPYAEMLERQMAEQVDSWAIRWWWSMFRKNALGLFPPQPLVVNIGDDATATHGSSLLRRLFAGMRNAPLLERIPDFPNAIVVDEGAQGAVEDFLRLRSRRLALGRTLKWWLR